MLSSKAAAGAIAVRNSSEAKAFYEGKLGLKQMVKTTFPIKVEIPACPFI